MTERMVETLDWLYSLEARGEIYKLERMEHAMDLIGNPHQKLRAVHIAGTKGKGSVAAMLDSCLRAAGLRTGLYTKPHLVNLSERTRIDGRRNPGGADARVYRTAARDIRAHRDGADVFRVHRRADVSLFRRRTGRPRDYRDRPRRPPRLDQRGAPVPERDHADRFRSHGISGLHHRGDRGGKGRDHQVRDSGGDWRARPRSPVHADLDGGAAQIAGASVGPRFFLPLACARPSNRLPWPRA